jgi:hypothetical protein
MEVNDAKLLEELELEKGCLKRLFIDTILDKGDFK